MAPQGKPVSCWLSVLSIRGAWAQDCWYLATKALLPGLLKPPGNLFTVLLVTQCVPANTLSLLLSLAGQVFLFPLFWEAKWLALESQRPD